MFAALRHRLFAYREQFKNLDRKWHFLIGSQLLFAITVVRMRDRRALEEETKGNDGVEGTPRGGGS